MIYKATKRIEIEPLCFFSTDLSKSYSSYYLAGEKKGLKQAHRVCQWYYCNKFFINSNKQERHSKNCSGIEGIVYNFNNQNLISYQDNFNAKGDVPFVVYFDFETTAPIFNFSDPEQKQIFVVSYIMLLFIQS